MEFCFLFLSSLQLLDMRFSIYSVKWTVLLTVKQMAVGYIVDRLMKGEDFSLLMA